MAAAEHGNAESVWLLLSSGAKAGLRDDAGMSARELASQGIDGISVARDNRFRHVIALLDRIEILPNGAAGETDEGIGSQGGAYK